MLKYLKISNLAIIDHVEVEFHEGFNVLTGETGAGKSILIGALDVLLGGRASQDLIRTGEEEAHVEGLFEGPEGRISLQDDGTGSDVTGELILSRRITRSGKSRCAINGNMAGVSMLQKMGRGLVSIFGQHEHQTLLDPSEHLEILDRFGGLVGKREETARAFHSWMKTVKDRSHAEEKLAELERLAERNAGDAEELMEARLREGEEDELAGERELLKKASQIRERAFEAYQALYSRSGSLLGGLQEVRKAVEYLAQVNPKFSAMHENLEEAMYRLEDVSMELRRVSEGTHGDPVRLDAIEERLALVRRLKKKYGMDVQGLINHLEFLNQEAGDVLEARAAVRNLTAKDAEDREAYLEAAKALSHGRRQAAGSLGEAMSRELKDLAMPHAVFSVVLHPLEGERTSAEGLERGEFYLASNPGEEARPLARIASGGELSRLMLALKALVMDTRSVSTVIFDEVDAGIGGHTAFSVGSRLSRVAKRQQVLCVTHLHQIAALADHHLSVRKTVRQGRTHIEVNPLGKEQRVDELARMLGASPDAESVKDHVRRLMDREATEVSG